MLLEHYTFFLHFLPENDFNMMLKKYCLIKQNTCVLGHLITQSLEVLSKTKGQLCAGKDGSGHSVRAA